MKKYHVSKLENTEVILEDGIFASMSTKDAHEENLQHLCGVYFFDNLDQAHEFGRDQNDEYAIFEIVEHGIEYIKDIEYDSGAYFIETDDLLKAKLIEIWEF